MSKPASKRKSLLRRGVIAPLVVLAVLFVFFEIIARTTGISEYILPAPSKIVSGIWEKFPVDIWPHFILTLKVILIGFAVATALGMLLAARAQGRELALPPLECALGALLNHLRTPVKHFQPSNAHFGLMPELDEKAKKKDRKALYSARARERFAAWRAEQGL